MLPSSSHFSRFTFSFTSFLVKDRISFFSRRHHKPSPYNIMILYDIAIPAIRLLLSFFSSSTSSSSQFSFTFFSQSTSFFFSLSLAFLSSVCINRGEQRSKVGKGRGERERGENRRKMRRGREKSLSKGPRHKVRSLSERKRKSTFILKRWRKESESCKTGSRSSNRNSTSDGNTFSMRKWKKEEEREKIREE